MKKTKITLLALLFSVVITAQVKHSFEAETQTGYEYNYFKSPNEVHQNGEIFTADDLIASSLYQYLKLDYDYRKRWGKHRFRFSAQPEAIVFYENTDDSYWSFLTHGKYDYRFNRSTRLLGEVSFKRMNREGLDGAQDVLINPLGYTNYGAKSGVRFGLLKNNKTTIMALYNFRNFNAFGIRDLQFNEMGVQFKTEQVFKVNSLTHKYGLTGFVKKRKYTTYNATLLIPEGERHWGYFKTTAFYTYPIAKQLEVKPSFVYYLRTDKDKRSGFNQYGPGISLRFSNKNTKVRTSFQYLTRNYNEIEARDNNGLINEKIQYNYANFVFNAEHSLSDHISLTSTVYSRIRQTNYTSVAARSFRGYRHQYAGIGVKWEI